MKSPGGYGMLAGPTGPAPFNGNYASLFPGAYQVVQTDRGLSYGATMAPVAGNSSTAAMGLSGALAGVAVPIWIRFLAGGTADIYYDGIGVTPAMAGVPCASSIPIILTGPAAGILITPTAGSLVAGNTWKATCASLSDQSGNAKHATQGNAAAQPIVTVGLNGKPGLLFDGVDDFFQSTVGSLFSYPYQILVVGRIVTSKPGANVIVSGQLFSGTLYEPLAGAFGLYNGAQSAQILFGLFTNQRWSATFLNPANDVLQIGPLMAAGLLPGTQAGDITRTIGAGGTGTQFANVELFAVIYTPPVASLAAFDAALNSPQGYGPGAIAV